MSLKFLRTSAIIACSCLLSSAAFAQIPDNAAQPADSPQTQSVPAADATASPEADSAQSQSTTADADDSRTEPQSEPLPGASPSVPASAPKAAETPSAADAAKSPASQPTSAETSEPTPPQLDESSELAAAFRATPPERAAAGQKLAQSPENLAQIDKWIAETYIDNPQNLVLKDLLMAMPVAVSGPRLVELAKKTNTPNIQESWARWLNKYPDAYETVLRAWMKLIPHNTYHFLELLREYAKLNEASATDVWSQLVRNFPRKELGDVASFGLGNPRCSESLAGKLVETWTAIQSENAQSPSPDDPRILRLMNAMTQYNALHAGDQAACAQRREAAASADAWNGLSPETTATISQITDILLDANISRRIAAIDFCFGWAAKQPQIEKIYKSSKNSTEKAHALRTLHSLCDAEQPQRLMDALKNGDENLRLEAVSLIAASPQDDFPLAELQTAFTAETWPEIQIPLYQAIIQSTKADAERIAFQKSIFLDNKRSQSLRMTSFKDLAAVSDTAITLADMETLLKSESPLEIIAPCAEYIYARQPGSRPKLRTWIEAQQPFERRLLATFAQFMRIDAAAKDSAAIETMRTVCAKAHEQENILQPCIIYFESNAQTDADRMLLENMQQRKNQFDAMMNIEF